MAFTWLDYLTLDFGGGLSPLFEETKNDNILCCWLSGYEHEKKHQLHNREDRL